MHVDGLRAVRRTSALYRDRLVLAPVVLARFPKRLRRLVDQVRHHRRSAGRRDLRVFRYVLQQGHHVFVVLRPRQYVTETDGVGTREAVLG